jgi:hypothetical protein
MIVYLLMLLNTLFLSTSDNELKLTYAHTYKESSKSSYSINEKWILGADALIYSKSYTGRLGNKESEKKLQKLTKNQIGLVEKLLEEKKLYKNIPSPKYSDFKNPYTSVHVNLMIEKNSEKFEIDLYDIAESLDDDANYKNIKSLEILLNSFVEK